MEDLRVLALPARQRGEAGRSESLLAITPGGELIGFLYLAPGAVEPALGGLTLRTRIAPEDAMLLGQATRGQLRVLGSPAGAHHCLVSVPDGATRPEVAERAMEALRVLRPLADENVLRVAFTRTEGDLTPAGARAGLIASATAAGRTAIEWLGVEPAATAAAGTPLGGAVASALGRPPGGSRPDVLLLDAPVTRIARGDESALRGRVIVALGAVALGAALEERLAARGAVLVPDALACCGALADDAAAVADLVTTRTRDALERAERHGTSLRAAIGS